MDWASMNGHVDVLQWWLDSGFELKYTASFALSYASENGHIPVLNWWRDNGLELLCSESHAPMDFASKGGRVKVLKWWERHGSNPVYTRNSMDWPAFMGILAFSSGGWTADSG